MKAKWRKDWSEASSEDFQDAARTLRGMFKIERDRGNTGLSITLDGAAYALDRFSSIRQLEHVVYDMKTILLFWKPDWNYKPWWPRSPYMPVKGWPRWLQTIVDFWDAVTDKMSWDPDISPSYPDVARRLTDNVRKFISWWVFPWRRWRWRFMTFFANHNGGKLLYNSDSSTHIRNREADCCYYDMEFVGLHYRLTKTRWVNKNGEGQNTYMNFVYGFVAAMSDNKEAMDEAREEAQELREEKTVISSGWVFGVKSFVREMDKIIEATPDLGWIKSY